MNGILYYPYIDIPRTEWTYRALFYYDTIASIVPQEFIYEPQGHYEPFMWELVREGFVVPIDPIQALENPWEIGEPFLRFVQSDDFPLHLKRRAFREGEWGRIHKDKFVGSRIHSQKFADSVYYSLTQIGLAKRGDGNWYDVEKATASYLMEYLATILSEKLDRMPTTDTLPTRAFSKQASEHYQKTAKVLEQLIPFPREVNLSKLFDFKFTYPELLAEFRTEIQNIIFDDNLVEGSDLYNNRVERLRQHKEEVSERMKENKIKDLIWGSCGVISAGVSVGTAAGGWAVMGAIAGLAVAINSALQIERPEKVIDQSGMKYLALLDKRIGYSRH